MANPYENGSHHIGSHEHDHLRNSTLNACWDFLNHFCRLQVYFKINLFKKKSIIRHWPNTIRVSNNLDPDQERSFVGPDMGPNCLEMFYQQAKLTCQHGQVNKRMCVIDPLSTRIGASAKLYMQFALGYPF